MRHTTAVHHAALIHALVLAVTMTLCALPQALASTDSGEPAPFSTRWSRSTPDAESLHNDLQRLRTLVPSAPAWVWLGDKQIGSDTEFEAALEQAESNLSPRALARRQRATSGPVVDFLDVPVPSAYVAQVRATGAKIRIVSRWMNAISVEATDGQLEAIAELPFVVRLSPVAQNRRTPAPEPSPTPDSHTAPAVGLDYGPSLAQLDEIQVTTAHTLGYTGAGVLVCMLDTGYFKSHDVFQTLISGGRLIDEWDFINGDGNTENEGSDDENQHNHGTVTWSTAGGFTPGEVIGPAYGAMFMLGKTEDVTSETIVEEDNFVGGLERADTMGADIVSSSLSYSDWYTTDDMDGQTAITTNGVDIAASRNILCVTSAGNQGNSDWHIIAAPADADSCIAVGSMNSEGEVSSFSSRGPTADGRTKPEVCARGEDTICAIASGVDQYGSANGTSLSCPLVAGAAALVMEAHPAWTAMQVREALMQTAGNSATPDNDQGWGRIQVVDAMNITTAAGDAVEAPVPRLLVGVSPNPLVRSGTIDLSVPGNAPSAVTLRIYDVNGRLRNVLLDRDLTPGTHRVQWDARRIGGGGATLAPGVYFLRADIGGNVQVVRAVITP